MWNNSASKLRYVFPKVITIGGYGFQSTLVLAIMCVVHNIVTYCCVYVHVGMCCFPLTVVIPQPVE